MKSKYSVARWFFKNYPDFAETVQSPFDGDLREKLKEWGYDDSEELSKKLDKDCDFDVSLPKATNQLCNDDQAVTLTLPSLNLDIPQDEESV